MGEPTPTSSPRGRRVSYRRPLLLLLVLVLPCYPTSSLSFSAFLQSLSRAITSSSLPPHQPLSLSISHPISLFLSASPIPFSNSHRVCGIFLRKIDRPSDCLSCTRFSSLSLSRPPFLPSFLPSSLFFSSSSRFQPSFSPSFSSFLYFAHLYLVLSFFSSVSSTCLFHFLPPPHFIGGL